MRRTMAVVAALVCTGSALAGCSSGAPAAKPMVDKADLQKDISARLQKAGQKPESVTCKDNLKGEVGTTTRCEVVLSATNGFEPIVTVTKVDDASVSYAVAPAVNAEQLQQAVATMVSQASGATVDSISCESGLTGTQGAQAHCDVTAAGTTLRRTVEVTTVDGLLMNFTVIPVLPKAQVQSSLLDQLQAQLGRRPDSADCVGDLEGKPGNAVDCAVVAGDENQDFTLTVTTVDGDTLHYGFAPKA